MVRTAGSCVVRSGKVRQGTQLFEFCSTLRSYKWVQSFSTLEDVEDMKRELSAWSFDWEEIGVRLNDDTGSGYVVSKYIGKVCGMWVDNLRWNSCSHLAGWEVKTEKWDSQAQRTKEGNWLLDWNSRPNLSHLLSNKMAVRMYVMSMRKSVRQTSAHLPPSRTQKWHGVL